MAIKCKQSVTSLTKFFTEAQNIIRIEVKRTLIRLGEECIIKIRDRAGSDSWFDITGNLRSSIGYAVYDYGVKEMESAFAVVKNGTEGAETGRKILDELAKLYADTYALVVIAGMNYAAAVEARDNKDVLASTELWAKSVISARMEKAKESAINKINKLMI